MRRSHIRTRWTTSTLAGLGLRCLLAIAAGVLYAASARAEAAFERPLQLQVFVNDVDTQLIASFREDGAGHLSAQARELEAVGLRPPDGAQPLQWIPLDDVASLSYEYDEPGQLVRVRVGDAGRARKDYSLRGSLEQDAAPVQRGYGALLNYDLFSAAAWSHDQSSPGYSGASVTLDARLFSPFGTLSQSAIVGHTLASGVDAMRLDTYWSYSDPDTMINYRAGDAITSGLAWTRPIRIGGLQAQRNFGLRPDLVTLPLPSFSGSAAVPTSVDVYVDNVRMFTQDVDAGPYNLSNLPLTGTGSARFVTVDAAGRRSEHSLSFMTSPLLLRPGLTDFSIEAGFPRGDFGVRSFDYSPTPVLNASLRRGITDWLTGEAHGEATEGFGNVGVGAAFSIAGRALLNVAASGSYSSRGSGVSPYVSLETRVGPLTLSGAYQRSLGDYEDLASFTADKLDRHPRGAFSFYDLSDPRPARESARVNVSSRLWDGSSLSLGLARVVNADDTKVSFANLGWSRSGPRGSSIYASAYTSVSGERSSGAFVGFSMPFGEKTSVSSSVTTRDGKIGWGGEAVRYLGQEDGSYGWRLRNFSAGETATERSASGAYRSPYGTVEATAGQYGRTGAATIEWQGSLATLGNGVYASNRIDDAFAVVDAKAPNVPVLLDNRPVGKTGSNGKLLLPDLRSWQTNSVAIDASTLPVEAQASETQRMVRPGDRQGVVVDFGVNLDTPAAIVVLVDAKGVPLPAGSRILREGQDEPTLLGYDGRAYLLNIQAHNRLIVETTKGRCSAQFDFARKRGAQQQIGPVTCQ